MIIELCYCLGKCRTWYFNFHGHREVEDGVTHDLLVDVKVVMYVQEDLSIFIEQVTF